MAIERFGVSHTWKSTWKVNKGKGVLGCVIRREKRRGMAIEPGVKWIVGAKEIGTLPLARRFPSQQGDLASLVPLGRKELKSN